MDTILQLTRHLTHNSSPSPSDLLKYSPTDSLKLSSKESNKRIERRKPNWTEAENVFLLDQFAIHREILTCKATDASTNLRKQEVWRLICANLNQNNTLVRRTPAEVRRKWKNLVTAAKKEVWEMRHQLHMNGGSGNVRKISELSQRVLQLHSGGNLNSNHNATNGILGALAQLNAAAANNTSHYGGVDYSTKKLALKSCNGGGGGELGDDKGFLPAHFTPIITLSESNNNHINLTGHDDSDGAPSPIIMSEDEDNDEEGSSGSRNAGEFMSDSGIYEHEGIDLRVNRSNGNPREHHNHHIRFNGRYMDDMDDDESNNNRNENNHHENDQHSLQHEREDPRMQIANYLHRLSSHAQQMAVLQNASVAANKRHSLNNNNNTNSHNNNNNNTPDLMENDDYDDEDDDDDNEDNNGESTIIRLNRENQILRKEESRKRRDESPMFVDPSGSIVSKAQIVVSKKESKLLSTLYTERLRLQIEILKLRKRKLMSELRVIGRGNSSSNKQGQMYQAKLKKYNNFLKKRNIGRGEVMKNSNICKNGSYSDTGAKEESVGKIDKTVVEQQGSSSGCSSNDDKKGNDQENNEVKIKEKNNNCKQGVVEEGRNDKMPSEASKDNKCNVVEENS